MPAMIAVKSFASVISAPARKITSLIQSMLRRPKRSASRPASADAALPSRYTTKIAPIADWLSANGGKAKRKPT